MNVSNCAKIFDSDYFSRILSVDNDPRDAEENIILSYGNESKPVCGHPQPSCVLTADQVSPLNSEQWQE